MAVIQPSETGIVQEQLFMKVVVLGAGGWGALVGAYLARVGAQVTLLFRRQAHVDAIRQRGLVIEGEQASVVEVQATTDPADVKEADLLIVAVKNQDTEAALESVAHMKVRAVASVQNGLGHGERFRQKFPDQEILRMVSRVSGSLLDYGRVHRGDNDFPTWIGDAFHGITPFAGEVVDLFNRSGLPAYPAEDIDGIEWCKLIWWVPTSIAAVLCRLPTTAFMQMPDMAYLMVRMAREEVAVAEAAGFQVRDYPTIEIMGRVQGSLDESVNYVIAQGRMWEEHGGKGYNQGMLLDIERQRRTEIEDTGGYIVRLADEKKIPVPYLETGYRVVKALEQSFT
jgi:2-dehydropantoate 2-reductase